MYHRITKTINKIKVNCNLIKNKVINNKYKQHLLAMWVRWLNSVCGLSYGNPDESPKVFYENSSSFIETITEKGEDYENLPSKCTHCCLSVMARQWQGQVTKLSLWTEFSPFPWQNSEYLIKIKIRCSKRNMSKNGEERDNSPSKQTCHGLSVLARLRWELVAKLSLWAEFSSFPSCRESAQSKK